MTGTFHEYRYTFLHISLSSSLNEKYFRKQFVKKIKTCILFSVTLFSKNLAIDEITWETIVRAKQVTDDSMKHAHCMLDT